MPEDKLKPLPTPELRDRVRTGFDAAVAAIPGVGGSLVILVDSVIAPSISRRRDAWLQTLADLVDELSERVDGWDPTSLEGNEVFVTAVADASRIALGTHLEEKLEMLKNCLRHMVLEKDRNDFLDLQLFRFVEDLSPEHFLVLQYLENPGAWFDGRAIPRPSIAMGSPKSVMATAKLPVEGPSLEIVLRDLNDRGLADCASLGTTMTEAGVWQTRTTDLGAGLLSFVREI